MKMRKRRINKLLLTGLLLFIITGCSTTKHLPEDELLYIGTPTPKIVGYNEADYGEPTLFVVQGFLFLVSNNTIMVLVNVFSRYWLPTRFMYLPLTLIPVQR